MDKYVNDQSSSWQSSLKPHTDMALALHWAGRWQREQDGSLTGQGRNSRRPVWKSSKAVKPKRWPHGGAWDDGVYDGVLCVRGRQWGRVKAALHRARGGVAQFTDGGSGGKDVVALILTWLRGVAAASRRQTGCGNSINGGGTTHSGWDGGAANA
jgi:hypothetical protein